MRRGVTYCFGMWNHLVSYVHLEINYQAVKFRNRIGNIFIPLTLIAVLLFLPTLFAFSQDSKSIEWSQFRGKARNGFSAEKGLLDKWPDNGPECAWKMEIGSGFSEVVVAKERIYTLTSELVNEKGHEYAMAFDMKTGNEIWKTVIDSIFIEPDGWGNGPRSTPVVDETNIYCFSSFGKLTALSNKDGKVIWKVDFVKEFKSAVPRWAFSTSPILVDDLIIMEAGGKDSKTFVALDKETGKTIWEKGGGRSGYSSPTIAEINNQIYIVFANDSMLYSFDSKGNSIWTYKMPFRGGMAMPLFIEPNKIFVSRVNATGSFIIQIKDNKANEVMRSNAIKNDWSSSCYYDGHIYGFNIAKLQCVSIIDSELKWSKRGFGKGSLIIVDKKLLILTDKGVLKLADASPEEYNETGSVQALEGKSWTAPSFSNGRIFLRNLTHMSSYILK